MKRIDILDGLRGYFLFFMLINHMILTGGLWLRDLTLAQAMFVEDAQGFVFLSGFLIGLLQLRRLERAGAEAMRISVHHRAFELYLYAMGVIVVVYATRDLLPGGVYAFRNWVGLSDLADPARLGGIATMIFQPTFMDILPQYILYLLVAPILIVAVARGRWALVMAISALVWMAAQIGISKLIGVPLHALARAADGQGLRSGFNPMGWQILFVTGLVLGVLTAQGRIDWGRVFAPERTTLPLIAAMTLLFFLPVRIVSAQGLIDGSFLAPLWAMSIRQSFGPVYLVSFAAAATLLSWLMIGAPGHASAAIRRVGAGVRAIGDLWILRLMGRHSLQTYAWHVLLVYALRYLDAVHGPFGTPAKTVLAATLILLLPLPALWREYGRGLFSTAQRPG